MHDQKNLNEVWPRNVWWSKKYVVEVESYSLSLILYNERKKEWGIAMVFIVW